MAELRRTKKLKSCKALRYDKSPCGRPLYDDKHCIFHSEDIKGKKEAFEKAFWEEFKRQSKEDKVYDFSGFIFPKKIDFTEVISFQKPIYFIKSQFLKSVSFSEIIFAEEADFSKCIFSNVSDFSETIFLDRVCLSESKFLNKTYFMKAKFSKYANFSLVTFLHDSDFWDIIFVEEASFRGTTFSKKVDFFNVTCLKPIDFNSSTFHDEVTFECSNFHNKVTFYNATFSKNTIFDDSKFFKEVIFKESVFKGKVTFENSIFLNKSYLQGAFFEEVSYFYNVLRTKKKVLGIFKTTKYICDDFRFTLSQNAATKYPIINKKTRDAWFLADFKNQHPTIYWLWNITSKCGQSLARWALVSFLIALLFGAIYADYSCPSWLQWMNLGNWMEKINPIMAIDQTKAQGLGIIRKATWFTPYYFSIVTFTTLGFGDVTPVNLAGEIWLAIEVILGYIMLGGLISIFANKLARRS